MDRRLAVALLAGTCLSFVSVVPAHANGGAGGDFLGLGEGGAGGSDSTAGSGSPGEQANGTNGGGGGGGSGTTSGGAGGAGIGAGGGAAGTAGTGAGGAGGVGGNGGNGFGAGGGGGGAAGLTTSGGTTTTTVTGGFGGAGGTGNAGGTGSPSGGGGGGAGGYGAIVSSGTYTITAAGAVTGGSGGAGGAANQNGASPGPATGGKGGTGGIGVFLGSGATLNNAGIVTGGTGGAGGAIVNGTGTAGTAGAGGAGVFGSGISIVNSGTISGGVNGLGSAAPQPNAITFTGGSNTLTLHSGSTINGNIAVTGSLTLSQPTDATLSNTITGTGSVTKTGAGVLTLTGASTYTGGTAINGGTLSVSSNGSLGSAASQLQFNGGTLQTTATMSASRTTTLNAGGGTIETATGATLTLDGTIVGSGGLTKTGSGTLSLTRINNYIGGTTINGGTIALTQNGDLGRGELTVNGGTLRYDGGVTDPGSVTLGAAGGTFETNLSAGVLRNISGAGALTKTGAESLTLLGNNTYQGGTRINGGSVIILNDAALGDASGGLTFNGGTLLYAPSFASNRTVILEAGGGTIGNYNGQDGSLNGNISGAGGLVKINSGVLTLGGTNSYGGGTTVNGGVLRLGAGGSLLATGALTVNVGGTFDLNGQNQTVGALSGNGGAIVLFGGSLTVDSASDTTLASVIGGGGSLIKNGAGALTLTGASSYNGSTTVNDGVLRLGVGGSLGSGALTINGGTFDLNGRSQGGGPLSGTGGTIALGGGGTLIAGGAIDTSVASIITGTGTFMKNGTGTLTLSGANAFIGSTLVLEGVLSVSADNNLGNAANDVTLGATLQYGASFDSARNIFVGVGTVDTNGFTSTLSGTISGAALVKAGLGTLILAGTNTYTSGTTVNAGTLQLGAGGSLAATGALAVNGGTFNLNGQNQTVGALFGTGGTIALNGGGILTTNSAADSMVNSAIVGTGSLVKEGTGLLILNGANTYSGGTTVSGGILAGTTTSLQGNILNNASVVFSQSGSGIYAGNMSGAGSLTLLGGTVTLSGLNTYSGGTTVSGGILQGTSTSLQGNILNNSTVVFDQIAGGTYGGNMSGTGILAKTGAGTLTLAGSNSYSGGTLVSGGVLQGTTSSLQGAIVNNASVVFNQAGSGTYAGTMSGVGSLLVNGTGTVILSGINSYTGGTTVSGGVLQGNTASLQGNILNNASVVFSQGGSGTYGGVMSGTGSMTLQGGGVLFLTGTNTYSGPTTVNASTLIVNGSLASTVMINNGGILAGTGTVGGLVSSGSTLAPGNSIGTLNVNGNFTQTGGTYVVEANAQGQADRINVTGTAAIGGSATVSVQAAAGVYQRNTTYTILNATGGVTGSYAGASSNFAFLTPSLSYNANNVFLTLLMNQSAFASGAQTGNQSSVGQALDAANASATGDFNTVLNALASLSTQQGPWALNQISGQPIANFGTANVAANALFMNAVGQQMALARGGAGGGQRLALAEACDVAACDGTSPWSVWASGIGGLGSVQGNGNASTFTYNVGGTAAGIDYRVNPSVLVGLGAGYTAGTQWVDSFQGKAWSNAVSVTAYGSFTPSDALAGFYADALAGYAYANNQVQRQLTIPGLQPRTSNGSTGANQFLGQIETGYQIPVYAPAAAAVTPFARFQLSSVNQAAFTEWGANSLSLNVAQQTTTSARTTFGAQLGGVVPLDTDRRLDLALRLGWLHEYADTARPMTAAFAGAPSNSFTVYGATPTRDSAVIGFSAAVAVASNASIFLRYDGELESGTDNHTLNVGLRMSW